MIYVDTHTHITDEAFKGEEDLIVSRALDADVKMMLLADIDSKERPAMLAFSSKHRDCVRHMAGLYPGSVDENWQSELQEVEKALELSPVAMGEIGLDYHFSTEFAAQQKEAFRIQLEMASKAGLPVNIHLRDATEDFFAILGECRHFGLRGNLHAYSGSWETFQRLSNLGDWWIGVGGVVTFKKASLAEVVKKVPLERILLETDAPYLTPVPHRGERNESAYIPLIAQKIAELKGVSEEEVATVTTSSANSLFRLDLL